MLMLGRPSTLGSEDGGGATPIVGGNETSCPDGGWNILWL
jgi:hypothetical protein